MDSKKLLLIIFFLLLLIISSLVLSLLLGTKKEDKINPISPKETIMWVAVGNDGGNDSNIVHSYDGVCWINGDGATLNNVGYGVAYGLRSNGTNPMWVAVGNDGFGGNSIVYSYDGICWSNGEGAIFNTFGRYVAYGLSSNGINPMWVAVGYDDAGGGENNIVYSYDGISWNDGRGAIFGGVVSYGVGVAYGLSSNKADPMWVAVGNDNNGDNNIVYSYDGISWSDGRGAIFNTIGYGVAYGLSSNGTDPMWVAVGHDSGGGNNSIVYSYNGISWSDGRGAIFSTYGQGVAYGLSSNGTDPMWVAVGFDGTGGNNNIVYSYDGISWNDGSGAIFEGAGSYGAGVAYRSGISPVWVAVGNDSDGNNNIVYSYDGISWNDGSGANFSDNGFGVAGNKFNPALGAGWPNN